MQTSAPLRIPHFSKLRSIARRLVRGVLSSFLALSVHCSGSPVGSSLRSVESGGMTRTYWLHVPPGLAKDQPVPLVLIYHGSGSDGERMERFTNFSKLADRHGFIAVYPDAFAENWNDGRAATSILAQAKEIDDISFTISVIDAISRDHSIDPKRIYATGFSNGGIFVHLLAEKCASRLAAIASISGGIAEPIAPNFKPANALSVFIVHGTKDPFVPYNGGNVDESDNGRIISTDQTVKKWIAINGDNTKSEKGQLPDVNKDDHSQVKWTRWNFPKTRTELLLYTIEGAGHTWPSGPQFLPISTIGEVDRDFDGATAIWDFFQKHPKP